MKRFTNEVLFCVVAVGIMLGPAACIGVAGYSLSKQWASLVRWRRLIASGSLIGCVAGYVTQCAAFFYQNTVGFEFNDATIRLEFVHAGSLLTICGIVLALFAGRGVRNFALIAGATIQLYWMVLVEQI